MSETLSMNDGQQAWDCLPAATTKVKATMTQTHIHTSAPALRIAAGVCTVLLAGCAALSKQPAATVPPEAVAAAPAETAAPAKSVDDEKVRLYPGTGVLVKAPAVPAVQQKGGEVTLTFEGADLREVVKTILADILRESYIMDPRVSGSITLHTKRPIPRAAILPTLETVLRMSGAVLLRQEDGVYQVVPSSLAGKGNLTPALGQVGKPLPSGYSIQVVPLKFIGAQDMAKLLEPLASEPGSVRVDLLRNLLILSGTEPELRHFLETVDMFDVDWISGMSVGLFMLQNVEVKTVVGDIEKVFGDRNLGPLAGAVRLVPIERLNALLVVSPQAKYLEQARTWVERLDRSGLGGDGQHLFVYQVQNGKAEALAGLLNDAFGKKAQQKAPAQALAPGLAPAEVKTAGSQTAAKPAAAVPARPAAAAGDSLALPQDVRVIADKDNNALLILASAADFEKIESALRRLDVVPRQVLIEVAIAEITLKDELSYGLEWFLKNGDRHSSKLDIGASGIGPLTPGFSYSWISRSGDINAVLNALATDSKLKIISSPHITVADNQTAKIQVGDRVPTITQTQSTANATTGVISSVQYLDTGVLLGVTPRVNAGGLVTMEINQEISSASKTTSSSIDSPTIQKRSASSTVTVQSGETLVMAGLIKEEQTRASSGLPLLSQIPLVGGLFGTQTRNDDRTELIILITPRVLKSVRQASDVTQEFRRRLSGLESMLKILETEKITENLGQDDSAAPARESVPPLKPNQSAAAKPRPGKAAR